MSYDIYIGERQPAPLQHPFRVNICFHRTEMVRLKSWLVFRVWLAHRRQSIVRRLELPDAPCFHGDELTGNGNSRHPGYSQWDEWAASVYLTGLFFNPEWGLMRDHPGIQPLTPEHLEAIQMARKVQAASVDPHVPPGWWDGESPELARLIWLEWWVDWALKHCKHPSIYNH